MTMCLVQDHRRVAFLTLSHSAIRRFIGHYFRPFGLQKSQFYAAVGVTCMAYRSRIRHLCDVVFSEKGEVESAISFRSSSLQAASELIVYILHNPPEGDRRVGVLGDVGDTALLRSSCISRNTRLVGGLGTSKCLKPPQIS